MSFLSTLLSALLLNALLYFVQVHCFTCSTSKSPLQGFCPPVFSPVDSCGSINRSVISIYAKFLKENGINGVLVGGTTGEGPTLVSADLIQLLDEWLVQAKKYDMHVIFQIGGRPLPIVLKLAEYAVSLGENDRLTLLTLPELYYSPKDVKQLVSYTATVAKACWPLKLMYYNIPVTTGVNLNMAEYFKQAVRCIPNFVGLKTPLENALEVTASNTMNENQTILVATDMGIAAAFENCLNGTIPGIANIFPKLAVGIRNAVAKGDLRKAQMMQLQLSRRWAAITSTFQNDSGQSETSEMIASLKAAMSIVTGIPVGPSICPLVKVTPQQKMQIAKKMQALGVHIKM